MMENAVTLCTWEEWEIQMGEGVGRAMGVGAKWELQMDRKSTQQDAACGRRAEVYLPFSFCLPATLAGLAWP